MSWSARPRSVPSDLIAPLFVKEGLEEPTRDLIDAGTGPAHDRIAPQRGSRDPRTRRPRVRAVRGPRAQGCGGIEAWNPEGIGQRAVAALRADLGDDAVVIADLCLDEYTDHGHCGVLNDRGEVDNDQTVARYERIATAQADAGAHLVAPSGMMDGQVARDPVGAGPSRRIPTSRSSPMPRSSRPRSTGRSARPPRVRRASAIARATKRIPANADEALREIRADIDEGADIVMVKPALPYLDIVRAAKELGAAPVAAYNVSGEYAMLKAAAQNGWLDERRAVIEVLTSIRRAGADMILTYHAERRGRLAALTARHRGLVTRRRVRTRAVRGGSLRLLPAVGDPQQQVVAEPRRCHLQPEADTARERARPAARAPDAR